MEWKKGYNMEIYELNMSFSPDREGEHGMRVSFVIFCVYFH